MELIGRELMWWQIWVDKSLFCVSCERTVIIVCLLYVETSAVCVCAHKRLDHKYFAISICNCWRFVFSVRFFLSFAAFVVLFPIMPPLCVSWFMMKQIWNDKNESIFLLVCHTNDGNPLPTKPICKNMLIIHAMTFNMNKTSCYINFWAIFYHYQAKKIEKNTWKLCFFLMEKWHFKVPEIE